MQRNCCRTPWDKVVNLSARQTLPTVQGKNFILQLDIFNFLNLLNKNWGSRDFGSSNSPPLLTRRSYVAVAGSAAQDRQRRAAGVHLQHRQSVHDPERVVELRAAAPAQVQVLTRLDGNTAERLDGRRTKTGRRSAPPFLRQPFGGQAVGPYRSSLNPGITSGRCAAFATIHPSHTSTASSAPASGCRCATARRAAYGSRDGAAC